MNKIEEVARALCRAAGKSPDEMQIDLPKQVPQWQRYEVEARKFIGAYNIMANEGFSSPAGQAGGTD
jgi:hypothetical protein